MVITVPPATTPLPPALKVMLPVPSASTIMPGEIGLAPPVVAFGLPPKESMTPRALSVRLLPLDQKTGAALLPLVPPEVPKWMFPFAVTPSPSVPVFIVTLLIASAASRSVLSI